MNSTELDRVRADLETMKRALGEGPPVGPADVWLSVAWALAGVPLAIWWAIAPVERWLFGLLLGVPVAVVLGLSAVVAARHRRQRGTAPVLWREHRGQWLAAGVAVPAFGLFLVWAAGRGLSPEAITVTGAFLAGLAMLIVPLLDRSRLYYVGWGGSTLVLAVGAPLLGYRHLGVVVGGWLLLSGLSAAWIIAQQLQGVGRNHAAD